MKTTKRVLAILLALCMTFGVFGGASIFAAESETVLFENNFESYAVDESPTAGADKLNVWSDKAQSATSTVTVQEEDGNKVLRLMNTAEKPGGPRLGKTFYIIKGFDDVSISYRYKVEGEAARDSLTVATGSGTAISYYGAAADWTDVKIDINLKKSNYCLTVGGKPVLKDEATRVPIEGSITVKFEGTVSNSEKVYYDDIKITTKSAGLNIDTLQTGSTGAALTRDQINQKLESVITTVGEKPVVDPANQILFTYDNNNGADRVNTGSEATWTQVVSSDYLKAGKFAGNEVMMAYNQKISKANPRVLKNLALGSNASDLTIEFNLFNVSGAELNLSVTGKSSEDSAYKNAFTTGKIDSKMLKAKTWNKVKFVIDFKKNVYSAYVNGKAVEKKVNFTPAATSFEEVGCTLNFVLPGYESSFALDDLVMYTKTPVVFNSLVYGTQGVNWDMVQGSGKTKDYLSHMLPHPRVLITDFEAIKEKVSKTPVLKKLHNSVMKSADNYQQGGNVEYKFSNGRNWLAGARDMRTRLYCLGYAYNMTGERKYVDKGLELIRYAGTFPDWSNTAPIISSEAMEGCSVFYDWCYYALSDEEKADIRKIICDRALWQFIHSYMGKINVEIAMGTSNRTTVANACGTVAALALYDEMPEVSDFVLEHATTHAMQSVAEYGADGGFPEGTMYWEYSTRYAVTLMAALTTAVPADYQLPDFVTQYTSLTSMENTGSYNLYNTSDVEKFNFGDAGNGRSQSPNMYWFARQYNKPFYAWWHDRLMEKYGGLSTHSAIEAIAWYDTESENKYSGEPLDAYFNDKNGVVGAMHSSLADSKQFYVGVQGGSNTTGHMFYSLGTFVIDANGKRFVQTLGQSNYSSQFSEDDYYQKRAEGQNVVVINPDKGAGQAKSGLAKFDKFESDADEAFSVLDLTNTYPQTSSYKRGTFMTKGRNSVVMQDEIKCTAPSEIYWFAHTQAGITLSEDRKSALLDISGEKMVATITSAPNDASFEIMESRPLPTSPVAGDETYKSFYKLAIHITNVSDATIAVEFTPIKKGEVPVVDTHEVKPISSWALTSGGEMTAENIASSSVALLVNSPVALANGERTYVDTANYEVAPIIADSRTLVPVRFISEKFGAEVDWNAETRTATVNDGIRVIKLTLGSDKMYVNDEEVTLDVAAQVVNDRTLIPLRALVEAMDKKVFWDDRGLIYITNYDETLSERDIAKIIDLLATRVTIGGNEFTGFTTNRQSYYTGTADVVAYYRGQQISSANGDVISFSVGENDYKFTRADDKYAGRLSTNSEGVAANISIRKAVGSNSGLPDHNTWVDVSKVTLSEGESRGYLPTGTVDNVINNEIVNRWSGNGAGTYITYDFGESKTLHSFGLATLNGDTRKFSFELLTSNDGQAWNSVIPKSETSGTTNLFDIFPLGDVSARYVKVVGYGDTNGGQYNSWTEVRFWDSEAQQNEDKSYWPVYFDSVTSKIQAVGDTFKLNVLAQDLSGAEVGVSGVKFTTSNPNVATVDDSGNVTAIKAGKVTITAEAFNGFKTISATYDFEIK